jgi:hypothetical protein
MARANLSKPIRRRLYAFAHRLASPFTDSRRQRFIQDMIPGLLIANHVHLSKVARAVSPPGANIHFVQKRLSNHLGSEHWDMSPLADRLLRDGFAFVADDSLLVADTTDLARYYSRKLEGLGRIHDGSDPEKRIAPGYALFEAYVGVGRWQLYPLTIEPLQTYVGAATSENAEIEGHVLRIHQATGGKGTWLFDRGFDRRNPFLPLAQNGVAVDAGLTAP